MSRISWPPKEPRDRLRIKWQHCAVDVTGETTQCYDRIAARYAATWCARPLDGPMAKFAPRIAVGGRVLDLGCGPGRDVLHLDELGFETTGIDVSRGMLAEGRARGCARLAHGDMRQLPFPPSVFDGIWWTASLLHLPRAQALPAVSEARRVMRPGASLFVGVQQGSGESFRDDPDGGRRFFCLYDADGLTHLLENAGFESVEVVPGVDLGSRAVTWLNAYARAC